MEEKMNIEIRFLSGRGGTYSSILDFLSFYDLPLSQVTFIGGAGNIVSAAALQPGHQYQLVITPDHTLERLHAFNPCDCTCCGDALAPVRGTRGRCAECFQHQLCARCTLELRQDWATYLYEHKLLTFAKVGAKVCMLLSLIHI